MGYYIVRKLIPNRISNKYYNLKAKFSFTLELPERLKGTKFEKLGTFCINLLRDYGEVIKETSSDIKQRPKKALAYAWGFWAWYYCVKTNPDELNFREKCLLAAGDIVSLPDSVRNKESSTHFSFLESCYNTGVLRRLNLGVCSFMWLDNYDQAVGLYAAHCKFLEPKYLSFHERIVDFGFLGRWWIMSRKMRDYDINPEEWDGEKKRILE